MTSLRASIPAIKKPYEVGRISHNPRNFGWPIVICMRLACLVAPWTRNHGEHCRWIWRRLVLPWGPVSPWGRWKKNAVLESKHQTSRCLLSASCNAWEIRTTRVLTKYGQYSSKIINTNIFCMLKKATETRKKKFSNHTAFRCWHCFS